MKKPLITFVYMTAHWLPLITSVPATLSQSLVTKGALFNKR